MDCWALCREVYNWQYDIEIGDIREQKQVIQTGMWFDVDAPIEGDVMLFKSSPVNRHVAIYLNGDYMLHSANPIGVVIEKWTRPNWKSQLRQIYRHNSR